MAVLQPRPASVVIQWSTENPEQPRGCARGKLLGRVRCAELGQLVRGLLEPAESAWQRKGATPFRARRRDRLRCDADELPALAAELIQRSRVLLTSQRHNPVFPALHRGSLRQSSDPDAAWLPDATPGVGSTRLSYVRRPRRRRHQRRTSTVAATRVRAALYSRIA